MVAVATQYALDSVQRPRSRLVSRGHSVPADSQIVLADAETRRRVRGRVAHGELEPSVVHRKDVPVPVEDGDVILKRSEDRSVELFR